MHKKTNGTLLKIQYKNPNLQINSNIPKKYSIQTLIAHYNSHNNLFSKI